MAHAISWSFFGPPTRRIMFQITEVYDDVHILLVLQSFLNEIVQPNK